MLCAAAPGIAPAGAGDLRQTIKAVKPSIVAVGTYQVTRRPPARLLGTGFAIGDGLLVLTNAHVVPDRIDDRNREAIAVFSKTDTGTATRSAEVLGLDREHDVAVLRITGPPLPPLKMGDDAEIEEGQHVAFTGYPIGPVLGLHATTHRGIVSAISPISLPQVSPRQLDPRMIRQLRSPFDVFQLDATAYPGNSGSPLYDAATGLVYGIVNSVFVKGSKERVLQDPSGITYAIPIRYAKALLEEVGTGR